MDPADQPPGERPGEIRTQEQAPAAAQAVVEGGPPVAAVEGAGAAPRPGELPENREPAVRAADEGLVLDVERAGRMCQGSFVAARSDDALVADAAMTGVVRLVTHPEVAVGTIPTWTERGNGTANWSFQFHALMWVDTLRRVGVARQDSAMLDRYEELLRSWAATDTSGQPEAWMDMTVGVRAVVLACAVKQLGRLAWLADAAAAHGVALADPDRYAGVGNHALHQNNGLIALGHLAGRQDWVDLGVERNTALVTGALDAQGVSTEGAVSYQWNNYRWLADAERFMLTAGARPGPEFARVELMPGVLAQMTAPDGRYEMLGDTPYIGAGVVKGTPAEFAATQGRSGPRPPRTLSAYRAGYLFNRSGWGERRPFHQETFYSLRFGPGRPAEVHGHADSGSLTLTSHGARLLWDQGMYTYQGGPMRSYVMSAVAHNRITIDGLAADRLTGGQLTTLRDTPDYTLATVRVDDLPGSTWERTVLYSKAGRYLVVLDDVSSPTSRTVAQNWHLPIDSAPALGRTTAGTRKASGANLLIAWGGAAPRLGVVQGRTTPMLGWRSLGPGTRYESPTVSARRTGTAVRFLTVLLPRPAGAAPGTTTARELNDKNPTALLTVTSGRVRERIRLNHTSASITRS